MIDTLGSRDRDLHAELATLQNEIDVTLARVTANNFSTPETGWNTWSHLDNLRFRHRILAKEAAMEDQRLDRLTQAVRAVGDPELGFIAYVVFGPSAVPVEPLYEIRLIDGNGYTIPESVRTNLPADRLGRAQGQLQTVLAPRFARARGESARNYQVQVTPF